MPVRECLALCLVVSRQAVLTGLTCACHHSDPVALSRLLLLSILLVSYISLCLWRHHCSRECNWGVEIASTIKTGACAVCSIVQVILGPRCKFFLSVCNSCHLHASAHFMVLIVLTVSPSFNRSLVVGILTSYPFYLIHFVLFLRSSHIMVPHLPAVPTYVTDKLLGAAVKVKVQRPMGIFCLSSLSIWECLLMRSFQVINRLPRIIAVHYNM